METNELAGGFNCIICFDEIKVLNEVPILQKGLNMSSSNLIPPAPIYVEGVRWGAMVVDMLGIWTFHRSPARLAGD